MIRGRQGTTPSTEFPGDEDSWLDRWVGARPVLTFLLATVISAGIFVLMYWATGSFRVAGGIRLNDTVTNYVGSLVTAVVALAGALVSVMLARLALKLGHKAKAAADQANRLQEQMRDLTAKQGEDARVSADKSNEIQEQMRKFGDPRLAETREGAKAAASLDLLGTLLRVYSAQTFSSNHQFPPPIEAIRHTYRRANDLVSDPGLYRYCAQLIGTDRTAETFAAVQSLIYQSTLALGRDGTAGINDRTVTARNAEKVAVEIAKLARSVEQRKRIVLADPLHRLNQLARDLDWTDTADEVSGCDATARADNREFNGRDVDALPSLSALVEAGQRSVIHVLETDLEELLLSLREAAGERAIMVHGSLRDYAAACFEGANHGYVDVIVARWDSALLDDPRSVADEFRYPRGEVAGEPPPGIGTQSMWDQAVFIARNPIIGRAITMAMEDRKFLQSLRQVDVSDDLYEHHGLDPAEDANREHATEEARIAKLSGKRLWYIHAALEELKQIHARKGFVAVPDTDPYADMQESPRAIVVIRPYFARIDMALPGPEGRVQDEWIADRIVNYPKYLWEGGRV